MPNNFNSITALKVTAMDGSLKIKIEMDKELKEKLEKHYGVDCAYKLLVGDILGTVDFEHDDDDVDVDGHCHELVTPREP